MKQLLLFFNTIISGSFLYGQKDAQKDWANLPRYQADNQSFTLGKKGKDSLQNQKTVLFLGDSITEGWVHSDTSFWAEKRYIGRGIGGQTSAQFLLRFRQDVVDLKPTIVIINAGTNDIAENTGDYSLDFTLGNIISMAEIAKANNIQVILSAVLPASEFVWRKEILPAQKIIALNQAIFLYAKKHNLPYIDFHTALKNEENGLDKIHAHDGVHPTLAAYKIMSELTKKTLLSKGFK